MESKLFSVRFSRETGGIEEIVLKQDKHAMNWVKPGKSFGVSRLLRAERFLRSDCQSILLKRFEENGSCAVAEYVQLQDQTRLSDTDEELTFCTRYSFDEAGNLCVRTTVKNASRWQKFFLEGDLAVCLNFYDDYHDANTCMTSRCTAHLWCGKDTSWVCALKMGESKDNLGLVFTQGGAESYSQEVVKTNDRGYFFANLDINTLRPQEEYTFSYVLFPHEGKEDFLQKIAKYPRCAVITSDNFTYFQGEEFSLRVENACGKVFAKSNLPLLSENSDGEKTTFAFRADALGEQKIEFIYGENGEYRTFAKVFVSEDVETVMRRRLDYIVEKQQYLEEGNMLDGAFLVYDAESDRPFYDEDFSDHNAQRERLGMTIMLARYLQTHKDEKFSVSLEKAVKFVYRNVFDEKTGEVFNFADRYSTWLRLYNFPWVALLLTEVFRAVGGKKYLRDAYTVMNAYYERGGEHFYPNGIFVRDIIEEFESAGMAEEAAALQENFLRHVEKIIERGTNYPPHEVNYEQTIVTPAVSFVLDAYLLTKDERYLQAVKPHLLVLERFDGLQPHYMLNNVAVRFWDDFWFGKLHLFGDTLPHYWSALSSIDYIKYAGAANDALRLKNGVCGLRDCLCLFMRDGSASCARVYPFEVNGVRGERYDPFCNDQDFALYFAYKYLPKER